MWAVKVTGLNLEKDCGAEGEIVVVVDAAVAPMFNMTLAPASYCNEPTRSGLPSLLKSPTARNSNMMSVWSWVPYIMTEPPGQSKGSSHRFARAGVRVPV